MASHNPLQERSWGEELGPFYEEMYGGEASEQNLIPWDIGGPQPVVQQLVAQGALRGEVLDPGTGPGHHAIYFAAQGYSSLNTRWPLLDNNRVHFPVWAVAATRFD